MIDIPVLWPLFSDARISDRERGEMDELEPGGKAQASAYELREIADTIDANPELADLDNPLDAAQLMRMDLDSLDYGDL